MSKQIDIAFFQRDKDNFNLHTERGMELLGKSVEEVGILEAVTVSNDEVVISGNARHEVIGEKFRDVEPIVVETDGQTPIIIKRTDIASGTAAFHKAALLANTVSKHNLNLDKVKIKEIAVEEYGIEVEELGCEIVEYGSNNSSWNIKTDRVSEDGDGIEELLGYNASSMWYGMPRIVEGISEKMIVLPELTSGGGRTSIGDKVKYSRTIIEEIRRVVVTYMEEGDFFLENCCGWSTFGAIAKLHGYSGIGVDIWDVALKYSRNQISNIGGKANVQIIEANAMELPFEEGKFDYIYCNPPFMDSELYSQKDIDIATSDPLVFSSNMQKLMVENYRVLKKGKLCTITISDLRKNGVLISMANIVINAGLNAGFKLHDFVIAENVGLANIMRNKAVKKKRTAKNHEYVITFIK